MCMGNFFFLEGWEVMDGFGDVDSYIHVAKKVFVDWSCVCLFFLLARADECGTYGLVLGRMRQSLSFFWGH
jgi:hypothetical protein